MAVATNVRTMARVDPHVRITWLLVAGLFVLRIPLLTGVPIFAPAAALWANPTYEIGTYFLTALLIWWERNRLADFHIDRLALAIFIFGKPLELLLQYLQIPFAYPPRTDAYLLYVPIAIGLGVALWLARPRLPKLTREKAMWLLISLLGGIALGVYFGLVIRANSQVSNEGRATLSLFIFLPIQQMLYAAIAEEPFFRGFLWGSLAKLGLPEIWIWLVQAGLFWLGHTFYLTRGAPWSFWFIIPVGGLVLGLLAWRSRSITTSMIAHGLSNGIGQIVGNVW
jgi:membrane protease YdiL (CAAX protease family)